ncbi:hypothetical protein MTO96_037880 [Rhipicephalus appendiculatus]
MFGYKVKQLALSRFSGCIQRHTTDGRRNRHASLRTTKAGDTGDGTEDGTGGTGCTGAGTMMTAAPKQTKGLTGEQVHGTFTQSTLYRLTLARGFTRIFNERLRRQ